MARHVTCARMVKIFSRRLFLFFLLEMILLLRVLIASVADIAYSYWI